MVINKMSGPKVPHYGWVIMLTGVAVLFACLGLGRFALGMLLPAMGNALGMSYSKMGLISTSNFIGYMLSVAMAGHVATWFGARRAITAGLMVVAISMLLISQCRHSWQILALYGVTGYGSGIANVSLIGLIGFWFRRTIRGRAAGAMITGNGLAIIFSGIYVPYVNASWGMQGWRLGWATMGAMVLLIAALAALLIRNTPADIGLEPMGPVPKARQINPVEAQVQGPNMRWKTLVHLGSIYALFGATYVVYATFLVTMLVKEKGYPEDVAGLFWAVVGILSLFSGPLFGWLSDKLGRKVAMIVVFSLFTAAYTLVAFGLPVPWLYLSIMLYGVTVWSVPTIMAATVGDILRPSQAAKAFGMVTLFFSAGQIAGPVTAGYLADHLGTFEVAFWMCAILTATAAALALVFKSPHLKRK